MTAGVGDLPLSFLTKVAADIVKRVHGINRVVYDITTKPPATIEWE
jgi:GMP synthase (glutamine-hydrolysing)